MFYDVGLDIWVMGIHIAWQKCLKIYQPLKMLLISVPFKNIPYYDQECILAYMLQNGLIDQHVDTALSEYRQVSYIRRTLVGN